MNLVSSLSVHVSLPYTVSTVHVFVSLFASYVYTCCIKNVKQLEKEACCCQLCSELPPHGVLFASAASQNIDRLGRSVHASTRHPWRVVQVRSLRTDADEGTSGPFQRRCNKGIRTCSWP